MEKDICNLEYKELECKILSAGWKNYFLSFIIMLSGDKSSFRNQARNTEGRSFKRLKTKKVSLLSFLFFKSAGF